MSRRILIALLCALIASALGSGLWGVLAEAADGAAAEAPPPRRLPAGAMAEVDLSRGEAAFTFTAPSGSVYDIWLFPAEEEPPQVHAALYRGSRLVAEGDGSMPALSLRLTAGAEYTLRLSGTGRGRLELARHALSRCFHRPLALNAAGDAYSKAFAREGDAHWYAVDADGTLPVALVGVPAESSLRLAAMVFDDGGNLLSEAARTAGGACLMDFTPQAGRRYYIRLWAEGGATGLYELRLVRLDGGALPDRVTLSQSSMTLEGRSVQRLEARVSPEDAGGAIYWESSDPGVARVDALGNVTGRGVGQTVITAYGAGGESASCRVEVLYVPVEGVELLTKRMSLSVGDDAAVECEVLPANASEPRLGYDAAPEGIVEIDRRGVLRGVGEGTAVVTVYSADGGLFDALTVEVGPAPKRWRALLVGEQNYASTVAAVRTGSVNSVAGLRSMLGALSFSGARFQVSTLLDASRDGALAAVDAAFAEAREGDLSLFYITCHGYYAGGMTCFQMYDGSVLTAAELAAALRAVKGDVLAVIDCCGSGGVIARASGTGDILKGIGAVFGGGVGPGVMNSSKLRVLASAALEQDSYRLSLDGEAAESDMATVFARALCEAGGWSIDRAARSALAADADLDGRVTLDELYGHVSRRVMWYLGRTGERTGQEYAQSVQVWPEADGTVIFERSFRS